MKKLTNYFLLFLINFVIIFSYFFITKYFILIPHRYIDMPFEHGKTSLLFMIIFILYYTIWAFVINYFFKQKQPPLRYFAYILVTIMSVDILLNILRYRFDFVSALGDNLNNFSIFYISFCSLGLYHQGLVEEIQKYFKQKNNSKLK